MQSTQKKPLSSLPSYMQPTASSKANKRTKSVIKPGPSNPRNPTSVPSYMQATASSKIKRTKSALGQKPRPATATHRPKNGPNKPGLKNTKRPKTAPAEKPKNKRPKSPKTPVRPIAAEPTLKGCKSAPRLKKKLLEQPMLSLDETKNLQKRRRTRFSVNKGELEQQLNDWLKNEHEKSRRSADGNISKVWSNLVELEQKQEQQLLMLSTVEKMIEEMYDLHLPHVEVWEALDGLKSNFPKVDIERFSVYWKAKAEAAINIGKGKDEVIELIQKGKKLSAQPPELLDKAFEDILDRYRTDPDLCMGKPQTDPDMTMVGIDEDDDIELSIQFEPSGGPVESTILCDGGPNAAMSTMITISEEPTVSNATIFDYTKGLNATFFRLVAHKKNRRGAFLVTPVRRSTRIANRAEKPVLNPAKPKGGEIDLEDLGTTFTDHVEILENTRLTEEDNIGIIDAIKNLTIAPQ